MKPRRVVNGDQHDATNPCLLTLQSKGFKLSLVFTGTPLEAEYTAEKDGNRFTAGNEVELLGLVTMWEARGPDWHTQDNELHLYEVLFCDSYIREADGRIVENPWRWL